MDAGKPRERVKDQLREFLEYLRLNRNASDHTVAAYHSDISQFLTFAGFMLDKEVGDLLPADLDRTILREFATDLYANKSARASTARKLSVLRTFIKYLRREGLIDTNPEYYVASPKLEEKVAPHLSVDEMSRLLEMPDASAPLG